MLNGTAIPLRAYSPIIVQNVVQTLGEVVGQVALGQVLGLQHGLWPDRDGLPLPLLQS